MISQYTPRELERLHTLWVCQAILLGFILICGLAGAVWWTIAFTIALRSTSSIYSIRKS